MIEQYTLDRFSKLEIPTVSVWQSLRWYCGTASAAFWQPTSWAQREFMKNHTKSGTVFEQLAVTKSNKEWTECYESCMEVDVLQKAAQLFKMQLVDSLNRRFFIFWPLIPFSFTHGSLLHVIFSKSGGQTTPKVSLKVGSTLQFSINYSFTGEPP